MHFEASWHAQGLRWIASLLERLAEVLERNPVEPSAAHRAPDYCVEQTRLRVHIRGL
jgi:hypothetical protein